MRLACGIGAERLSESTGWSLPVPNPALRPVEAGGTSSYSWSVIQAAIHAILWLATLGGTITGLESLVSWLDEHFGGLLPSDLTASVLDRRFKTGHRSDRRLPDSNVGRCRASDQRRFPPSFPAAA
jgi:hypothetical protein